MPAGDEEPVNTKMPSLVATSASADGSCIQKPRADPKTRTAVTMPRAWTTTPACGDTNPLPWMSWMLSSGGGGGGTSLLLCGVGGPTVKSALLTSVSVSTGRAAEVVFDVPAVGEVSRTTALP